MNESEFGFHVSSCILQGSPTGTLLEFLGVINNNFKLVLVLQIYIFKAKIIGPSTTIGIYICQNHSTMTQSLTFCQLCKDVSFFQAGSGL